MLLQIQWENPLLWLALFFITGLVAMIITAIIVSILVSWKRKQIKKAGEAAGVSAEIVNSSSLSGKTAEVLFTIEGCGYCCIFVVIIIISALGISLPIILPQHLEDVLMAVVMIVFGSLCWGVTVWAVPYTRREFRRLQTLLDNATAYNGET